MQTSFESYTSADRLHAQGDRDDVEGQELLKKRDPDVGYPADRGASLGFPESKSLADSDSCLHRGDKQNPHHQVVEGSTVGHYVQSIQGTCFQPLNLSIMLMLATSFRVSPNITQNGRHWLPWPMSMIRITSSVIRRIGLKWMVSYMLCTSVDQEGLIQILCYVEKGEWPPMKSANFEQEDAPGSTAKYDITAKPHTYYLEAEGTGAIPVNDVVVHVSVFVSADLRPKSDGGPSTTGI
jgi:hypothetical protein